MMLLAHEPKPAAVLDGLRFILHVDGWESRWAGYDFFIDWNLEVFGGLNMAEVNR